MTNGHPINHDGERHGFCSECREVYVCYFIAEEERGVCSSCWVSMLEEYEQEQLGCPDCNPNLKEGTR
jgi:hypothetical protein